MQKLDYVGSVHDEQEIAAVLEVLRGTATVAYVCDTADAFLREQGLAPTGAGS